MSIRVFEDTFLNSLLHSLHNGLMSGDLEKVKKIHISCKEKEISFSYLDTYMVYHFLNGFTILGYAISSNNIELVQYLVENTSIDINQKNKFTSTIMHQIGFGCKDSMDICKYLIQQKNIDINIYNQHDDLPIYIASFYGMKEYIQLLICHNSIFDIENCIYQASFCHHRELITWFEERRSWKIIQFQCEYGFCTWSPENHIYWTPQYKKMVFTILNIVSTKYTHFEKELLYNIFEYIPWF